jgi:hypothetical protein
MMLETIPYASSQSTYGSAGESKHFQEVLVKKPPGQLLESSGSPLLMSPSSAPPSFQSSFGRTLPSKHSRNQQSSVLKIIDSSDDDEEKNCNFPWLSHCYPFPLVAHPMLKTICMLELPSN